MLRGAERDLAADAAGGAGDDEHAARQEGGAAHDRSRRSGVQLPLCAKEILSIFMKLSLYARQNYTIYSAHYYAKRNILGCENLPKGVRSLPKGVRRRFDTILCSYQILKKKSTYLNPPLDPSSYGVGDDRGGRGRGRGAGEHGGACVNHSASTWLSIQHVLFPCPIYVNSILNLFRVVEYTQGSTAFSLNLLIRAGKCSPALSGVIRKWPPQYESEK